MPKSLPQPRACIFDLDGTLVNSLRDIGESFNDCLEMLGQARYPVEHYRFLVGEGIPALCQRVLGERRPELVPRLAELARARYRTRPLRHTTPYAGVPELVARLAAHGVHLGVLSNKPQDMTAHIVERLWPDRPFRRICGYVHEELRKPNPAVALQMCAAFGVEPGDTWVIGDTRTDIETARRMGAHAVGVTWGFRPRSELEAAGADRIVDRPEELR